MEVRTNTAQSGAACCALLAAWLVSSHACVASQWFLSRYLDASCLVFGPGQQFLEAVDYQRKQSSSLVGEPGAVSHSGDQLDEVARAGRHTISLNLAKLQPGVSELFMTLSSYGPARLSVCPSFLCPCALARMCSTACGWHVMPCRSRASRRVRRPACGLDPSLCIVNPYNP